MTPDAADSLLQDARLSWHPDDWGLKRLAEVCHVRNQLRKPLSDAERQQMQGPYPYYGPTSQVDSISEFRLDGVYALIGEDGDHFLKYDRMSMTQLIAGKSNVNNHAHILEGSDSCCTEWLFHFFRHRNIVHFLSRQGAGRYKLNKQVLLRLPVLVPPLPEQRKIAGILAAWDRAIELTVKLIAAKQKRKAALMQQLLTGKVRLPGFTEKWLFSRIGRFLTESRISGSAGDSAKKLTVKLYGKGVISKIDVRPGSAETKYFRRRAGQFIYSKLDFLNGAFGLIPPELDGYESTLDLPAFDVGEEADPRWLFHFVARESFYKAGLSLANGGRKARRVNPTDFLKTDVPFPQRREQQAIADVIETAVQEINLLRKKLDALRRQKKGLMQKLLTGRVRVAVAESSAE